MSEIYFVVKSLIITIVLILCLQVRVAGDTIENYANNWVHSSSAGEYLTRVAEGASLALKNGFKKANELVMGATIDRKILPDTAKAGRLNFELKPSQPAAPTVSEEEE